MKLEYTFYIGTEPEQVWEVLFNPEKSVKAFMGGVIQSSLNVGDSIEFVGNGVDAKPIVHIYGRVLAYEKYKLLSYTDHPGPTHHERHAELESRVSITLDKVGKCTRLVVINDQWSDGNPLYDKTYHYWWMILSNIKSIAETGESLDYGY